MTRNEVKYLLESMTSCVDRLTDSLGKQSMHIDNLWNEDFEDVPGTPGKGRQGSLGATFRW